MRRPLILGRLAILTALLTPTTLWADVTADDVWQNMQDYLTVFGGTSSATAQRDGDTLILSNLTYDLTLPRGYGKASFELGDLTLTETADGNVSILRPESYAYTLNLSGPQFDAKSIDMNFVEQRVSLIASGFRDDVTYRYQAGTLSFAISEFPMPEGVVVNALTGSTSDISGDARIKVGKNIEILAQYKTGPSQTVTETQTPTGDTTFVSEITERGSASSSHDSRAVFPRNGMDILNLSDALRNGLSLVGTISSTASWEKTSDYTMTSATGRSHVAFDADGMSMTAGAHTLEVEIPIPEMDKPMVLQIKDLNFGFAAPLLETDEFAPISMQFGLSDLAMDDGFWDLVDPASVLPRDLATVQFDLSGTMVNHIEWLDFMNIKTALTTTQSLPVEMQELNLNQMHLSAAGTEMTGTGAFVFDNTDRETFDGFPRVDGTLSLAMTGVNGLVNKFQSLGISAEQVSSARLMLGMFAKPDPAAGEDALKSEITLTPEGHVEVNGMRIR